MQPYGGRSGVWTIIGCISTVRVVGVLYMANGVRRADRRCGRVGAAQDEAVAGAQAEEFAIFLESVSRLPPDKLRQVLAAVRQALAEERAGAGEESH